MGRCFFAFEDCVMTAYRPMDGKVTGHRKTETPLLGYALCRRGPRLFAGPLFCRSTTRLGQHEIVKFLVTIVTVYGTR